MPFAQLVQNASAFIDIRKQVVTTVPGLLLAVALVFQTGTAPSWVARPFVCASYTPLKREAAALTETLRVYDSARAVPGRTNEDLIRLRAEEVTYRRQLQRAVIAVQGCDGKSCTQSLADLKAASDAVKSFVESAGDYRTEADTATRGAGIDARKTQNDLFEAHRTLAWLESDPTCSAAPTGWDSIAADVLMFGLLGFLLGLMLDPVNKAIFLQAIPEAAGSTGVFGKFIASRLVPHSPSESNTATALSKRRVQFYIGRGVITEAEYQALIDKYYRFAELTIGLVIPMLLTAFVLFRYEWLRGRPAPAFASLALVFMALALPRIGIRRHGEFRKATSDLVEGRLEKLQADEEARARTVNLLQLQQLVARAGDLMERFGR